LCELTDKQTDKIETNPASFSTAAAQVKWFLISWWVSCS